MSDYSKYIWYNSNIIPWEEANTHVMSHVLHYGSGVFEGIKCYKTSRGPAIFRLEDHINRLLESAALYRMKVNISKEEIIDGCKQITKVNNLDECYIRPIIFYGYDTLGVNPKKCPLNIAIASFYWGAYLGDDGVQRGVNVTISPYQKISYKAMPTTAKASGQYMNSLLSVTEAKNRGYDEAILLNADGNVAEGSGQNLFYVKDNIIHTNDETSSILLGITRDSVLTICENLNIETKIHSFSLEDLLSADEVFFTGTASEITPIRSIEDNLISNGEVGSLSLKLRDYYMNIVLGNNDEYNDWLSILNHNVPVDNL
tara:strand:- start:1258 stop:2202 length:945 start_codon:yes stop_codon:yes gene_type:complete